jgi:lipopolysaccharide biosynthesis protein
MNEVSQADIAALRASSLFDERWYVERYPDVKMLGIDPVEHYLWVGAQLGRKPSLPFDGAAYLKGNPDAAARNNPLSGAVISDQSAAAAQFQELLSRHERGFRDPAYRAERPPSFDVSSSRVKLLAYYLPQFHPIPENDAWWGKGFTDWTNVTRSLPQYPGHHQPHLPSDLGYYDLRLDETLQRQVALARQYGISGFCFYYYWFDGKRLLERPLDLFVAQKHLKHDFCLCWANENWTRRWDGLDSEVLIAQEYTAENDCRLIADVLRYMDDPRYISIDGRPALIVYRADRLPEPKATAERWRELAHQRFGKDLFLIYAMTFGTQCHPAAFGFDAAIQFPPHNLWPESIRDRVHPFRDDFAGHVFDYASILPITRQNLSRFDFPVIPSVFPNWDNTPRRGHLGSSGFLGSSPDIYATWLAEAAYHASRKPVGGSSLVVINAWNEWAESAHLEPDQRFGHAYLRATADVLRPYCQHSDDSKVTERHVVLTERPPSFSRFAVIIHAYYPDILDEILTAISIQPSFDLFITLTEDTAAESISVLARRNIVPRYFAVHVNRGRDVLPFLTTLREVDRYGYSYFLKLHTKKSPHRSDGKEWRAQLVEPLVKALNDRTLTGLFDEHPEVSMIVPHGHLLDGRAFAGSAGNQVWLDRLIEEFGLGDVAAFSFPAGTMFAARTRIFAPFANSKTLPRWFEDEEQRTDGTLAHALERFMGLYLAATGQKIATVQNTMSRGVKFIDSAAGESIYSFAQATTPIVVDTPEMASAG